MGENEVKDYLANNPMIVLKIQKLFDKMDGRCRSMALSRPARPMSDYCQKCQDMFKKELGGSK
jgi:hypothetical protein